MKKFCCNAVVMCDRVFVLLFETTCCVMGYYLEQYFFLQIWTVKEQNI